MPAFSQYVAGSPTHILVPLNPSNGAGMVVRVTRKAVWYPAFPGTMEM